MSGIFFKFPATPHLAVMDGVDIRKDKVMSEDVRMAFLQQEIVVEEKIDGANLGISFAEDGSIKVQNRGSYLTMSANGQWKKLHTWLAPRCNAFFSLLADRFILFGEWCYAKHSIRYERLPDWFLGFDIYDKQAQKFLASNRRNVFFEKAGIIQVPKLASGRFTYAEILHMFAKSRFASQHMEGLYLRVDRDEWLISRAKLVRSAFIQSLEQHWSHSSIIPNKLYTGKNTFVCIN